MKPLVSHRTCVPGGMQYACRQQPGIHDVAVLFRAQHGVIAMSLAALRLPFGNASQVSLA